MRGCVSRRLAVADDVRLRLLDWPGAGRPFLLVHGLASNALLWRGVAAPLATAGHRVVAVDLRGHGESDSPPAGHTTRQAAADLAAVIAGLGLDAPILVGQSWGGNVVLCHAETYAGVHAVACIDGGWLHPADRFPTWESCWASLAPPPLNGLTAVAFADRLRRGHPNWPDDSVQATVSNLRERPDGTLERRLALAHHASILRSVYDDPPRRWYAQVGVPVLLLPAADPSGASAVLVDEAARLLPRATVRWYAGADHDVHAQYPAEVAADLLELA